MSKIGMNRPPHTLLRFEMASRTCSPELDSTTSPILQGRIITRPRASAVCWIMSRV